MGNQISVQALRAQAAQLSAVQRHKEAIGLLSKAVATDPDSTDARCDLALAYSELGNADAADRESMSAVGSSPEYERGHRVRALILRQAGRSDEAIAAARQAVRLAPTNVAALRVLTLACISGKQDSEAWKMANKVVELEPDRSDSHVLISQAAIGMRYWAFAERACLEALRLDPNNWAAMNNLGVVLNRLGRRTEALQTYEQAARLNPRADVPRDNLVRWVNPGAGDGLTVDGRRVRLRDAPLLAPVFGFLWVVSWWRTRRTLVHVSPAVKLYYRSRNKKQSAPPR